MLGSRVLVAVKLTYVLSLFSQGAIWIYLPIVYEAKGFTKAQITVLQSLAPISFILGPTIWGGISDWTNRQRCIHIFIILSGSCCMFAIPYATHSFESTIFLVFLASIQSAPVSSLLDEAVMAILHFHGGDYGKQRMFGGIGYGLGAIFTGTLLDYTHDVHVVFTIHLVAAWASIVPLLSMPSYDTSSQDMPRLSVLQSLMRVRERLDVLSLFVLVLVFGYMFGVIGSYFPLFVYELPRGDAHFVGLAIYCSTLSELPAFFYADRIISRLGIVPVLGMSILAYGVRFSCYTVVTNPWMLLPVELLHSLTFSLAWTAFTTYVYRASPREITGTMIGFLSSLMNGYGKFVGTIVGGWIYTSFGVLTMWATSAFVAPFALLVLSVFHFGIKSQSVEITGDSSTSPLNERAALLDGMMPA